MPFTGRSAVGAVGGLEELFASQLAEELEREQMAALQEERLADRAFRVAGYDQNERQLAASIAENQAQGARAERADARAAAEAEERAMERNREEKGRLGIAEIAAKVDTDPSLKPVLMEHIAAAGGNVPSYITDKLKPKETKLERLMVPGPKGPLYREFVSGGPELAAGVPAYVPPVQASDNGLSPNNIFSAAQRLSTKWENISKSARETNRAARLMETGMEAARRGDLASGSQAIIVTFNKILDPTSVVRESEYDRTTAGMSLVSRVEGALDRLQRGGAGVPLPELENYARLAREIAAQTNEMVVPERERIGRNADYFGVPRQLIFAEGGPGETATPPPGGMPKIGEVVTVNGQRVRVTGFGANGKVKGVPVP